MTTSDRVGIDDLERMVITNVRDFGWHAVNVIEDDDHPPWSFNIGLYDTWSHPELILIGRSRATAHHILETIANDLDHDRRLDLTTTTDTLLPGIPCHFIEVAERYYSDYVGFARLVLAAGNSLSSRSSGPNTTASTPGTKKHLGATGNGNRCWEQPERRRDLPILSPYIIVRRYFLESDHDHRDTDQQGPNHHSSRGPRGARRGCRRSCGVCRDRTGSL
jgi:hypothetical protein